MMPSTKFQSSGGEIFHVDVDIAKQYDSIMLDEEDEEVVPLPNVTAAVLKSLSSSQCGCAPWSGPSL